MDHVDVVRVAIVAEEGPPSRAPHRWAADGRDIGARLAEHLLPVEQWQGRSARHLPLDVVLPVVLVDRGPTHARHMALLEERRWWFGLRRRADIRVQSVACEKRNVALAHGGVYSEIRDADRRL